MNKRRKNCTSQAGSSKYFHRGPEANYLSGFDGSTENRAKIKRFWAIISIAPFMVKHPCNVGNATKMVAK
jgi:hypothetical protein